VMVEHMALENADEAFGSGRRFQVTAALASYPLGLLDNLRAIALYDWESHGVYSFLAWQRTLDNWIFSIAAFWNPETPAPFGPAGGNAGKGVQLMVVFNH